MLLSIIQFWLAIMFIVCPGLTAQSNWSGGNLSKISEVSIDISAVSYTHLRAHET